MFRNMKTDLVINFSFSDCTARINIENPSSFKNASSAGGKSLVKPVRHKSCQEIRNGMLLQFVRPGECTELYMYLNCFMFYSKGFEPGSDSRSCSVIVRARVVLKRTVVSDSD